MYTETTYNMGLNLEERFVEYLRKERGYNATRIRVNMSGSLYVKGKEIDIIAEKKNIAKESLLFWIVKPKW